MVASEIVHSVLSAEKANEQKIRETKEIASKIIASAHEKASDMLAAAVEQAKSQAAVVIEDAQKKAKEILSEALSPASGSSLPANYADAVAAVKEAVLR